MQMAARVMVVLPELRRDLAPSLWKHFHRIRFLAGELGRRFLRDNLRGIELVRHSVVERNVGLDVAGVERIELDGRGRAALDDHRARFRDALGSEVFGELALRTRPFIYYK